MTEPIQPESDSTDPTRDPDEDFVGDVFLAAIVSMVNQGGDTSITLSVTIPGGILAGDLIGFKAWRDLNAGQLRSLPDEGAQSFAIAFDGPVWQEADDAEAEAGEERPLPRMIHFKDATLYSGTGRTECGLWRGRLSEVTGWTIGKP